MLESRLAGLTVAVDVQHLYRPSKPNDQGALFTGPDGGKTSEAQLSTVYAGALCEWFRARGATVITNDRTAGVLVGEYWTRNHQAAALGASVYLACHVNAGGGRYAMVEHMRGSPGGALGLAIVAMLSSLVPELTGNKVKPLARGERGAVCIQGFPGDLGGAVLLEPFFGDYPAHRPLWSALRLAGIAGAIGEGVARWWTNEWRARGRTPA